MSMTLRLHDVEHDVLAEFGAGAFNLLLMRMEALQLVPDEVRRIESGVFGDLAGTCAKCECKDRCERGLLSQQARSKMFGRVIVPTPRPWAR
jgi:hypothetical protein